MKTIKQLEKEIEELDIQHGIHTGISVEECSDNNCIDKPELRLLKAKLKILQEVFDEIKKEIMYYNMPLKERLKLKVGFSTGESGHKSTILQKLLNKLKGEGK